jgi:predicted 3-demethylubiquinone-9 3-methyltransferase (glyoxalase superfamily)
VSAAAGRDRVTAREPSVAVDWLLDSPSLASGSPAISFVVHCKTQEEVDDFWARLLEGGAPQQCGWLTDKFGLSWQIVPTILPEMLQDKDAAKAKRVMEAMLKMVKLDIGVLKRAYEQG